MAQVLWKALVLGMGGRGRRVCIPGLCGQPDPRVPSLAHTGRVHIDSSHHIGGSLLQEGWTPTLVYRALSRMRPVLFCSQPSLALNVECMLQEMLTK